jgi:D-cysteine desulfhydrase
MSNGAANHILPLFEAFPRLAARVPFLPVGNWPTPVTEARHFAATQGLDALYVKREDLAHPECGGNKTRGLEFTLADAAQRGARTIVTIGAAGSHHVCNTAWHARRFGIDTVAIVIGQPPAEYVRQNLRRGIEVGVRYIPANTATVLPRLIARLLEPRHRDGGRRIYYLPGGGTSPLACLGHVNAAIELKRQIDAGLLPEPEYLYVALGSLGTAAGLTVGCKLVGLGTKLIGVVVSHRWYCTPARWARLARRTHRLMRRHDPDVPDVAIHKSELSVITTALGRGYARFTERSVQLARQLYATEKIELDGTYTAKALDGAVQYISQHRLHDKVNLFWHTYQPAPPAADSPTTIDSLPTPLRQYFVKDTQPLDGQVRH